MKIVMLYLILINALAFILMLVDKHKAQHHLWRIPEFVLLSVAAIGGSLGAFIAMKLVRHKTRHLIFAAGIPIMLVIHIVCFIDLIKLGALTRLFR